MESEYYIRPYFMSTVRKLRDFINLLLTTTSATHIIISSIRNNNTIISGFSLLNFRTNGLLRVGLTIFEMRYTT